MSALELLCGDAQTFHQKVWASRIHLHHADPDELVGLLSLGDVDHLLTSTALRTPALRLAQDGSVIASSRFTRSATMAGGPLTGLVDARKVLDLYDGGATVVLQGLHRYHPPLTRLVRSLELELGHPCQANAYLTPPGAQGFVRHSDTHDVFVLQTHGHKQWEVVEPDGLVRDVLLEPGLSMYLPTGTPHSARSQDVASLHVTIGINRLTWRDLLRKVVDRALADDGYDAPLPSGWLDDPAVLASAMDAPLSALVSALSDLDAGEVTAERADAFLSERTPALAGGLLDRVGLNEISDETTLERRPTAACVIQAHAEHITVHLGDRALRMPARLRPVMEHIRDAGAFQVGDLAAWLDESSRQVVVRRLVREGLLRIAR